MTTAKDDPIAATKQFLTECSLNFDAMSFDWSSVKPHGLVFKSLVPRYSNNITSGVVLRHARDQVLSMQQCMGGPVCFKIGVTANPPLRFSTYLDLGYSSMWLLHASPSMGETHMLEAALISEWGDVPGNKNKQHSGGEGNLSRSKPAISFVYMVAGRADQPRWVG